MKVNLKKTFLISTIAFLLFIVLIILIQLGFPFLGNGKVYKIDKQGMKCFCNSMIVNGVCVGPQTCIYIDYLPVKIK